MSRIALLAKCGLLCGIRGDLDFIASHASDTSMPILNETL